jgi:hypothetical protein
MSEDAELSVDDVVRFRAGTRVTMGATQGNGFPPAVFSWDVAGLLGMVTARKYRYDPLRNWTSIIYAVCVHHVRSGVTLTAYFERNQLDGPLTEAMG